MSRDKQGASGVDDAKSFLTKTLNMRDEYRAYLRKEVLPLYSGDRRLQRTPPKEYHESSFLFVRGYPGDNGQRPFLGRILWRSPDIKVTPLAASNPQSPTVLVSNSLKAGQVHRVQVTVRNAGDRVIPSAKVELWFAEPTAGRSTTLARHLTKNSVLSVWVNPQSTATVSFDFTPLATEIGKRSLIARVFAFSPLDLPVDNTKLDPMADRHVAELVGLTVVP